MAETKPVSTTRQLVAGCAAVIGIILWVIALQVFGVSIGAIKTSREGDPAAALRHLEEGVDLTGYGYEEVRGSAACTRDCAGHEAGWRWAEDNSVFDPEDCGGKSLSFREGCRAWAEEQAAF